MRNLLLVVTIALFSTGLHAAERGERCKAPTSNPQYLCDFGLQCRQSIKNKYCSYSNKICGWKGTGGYDLGDDKNYKGKKYKCNANGFRLAYGERCELGTDDLKLTCATNARCLLAISKSYCSGLNKDCGWRKTSGFFVGQTQQWNGKDYECFANGFQELDSNAPPPSNPPLMGLAANVITTMTHKITSDSDLRALVSAADAELGFSAESAGPGSLCFIRWDNNTFYGPPRPFPDPRGVQFCANNVLPPGPPLLDMSTTLSCRFRAFAGLGNIKLAEGWKLVAAQVELPVNYKNFGLQYISRPVEKGNRSLEVVIHMSFGCLQLESVTLKGPSMQWRDAFE